MGLAGGRLGKLNEFCARRTRARMLRSSRARRSTSELHLTGFELSEPRRERHASVIAVAGELDIATAPRLHAALVGLEA